MPIFEYVCGACGKLFEKLVSGKTSVVCPYCGSAAVDKQLSSFAVSVSSENAVPDCSSSGCGFDRGGCGSGMCGHHHG